MQVFGLLISAPHPNGHSLEISANNFAALARQQRLPQVTVIIPIYNAPSFLKRNLESLHKNLPEWASVILVDDCSSDPEVSNVLEQYRFTPRWTLLSNSQNLGYTKSVNRGIRESDPTSDIVLLNSDALTFPGWLAKLRFAAVQSPQVGTVSPLSDNSGAFSVPKINSSNKPPSDWNLTEFGRLVEQAGAGVSFQVPTGNGFCLYIKRDVLKRVALFDEVAFPRGYGEENDFCMRASDAGWDNIVTDKVFVSHAGSKSFGEEKHALVKNGLKIVAQRFPHYPFLVSRFQARSFSNARDRIQLALKNGTKAKSRLLVVQPVIGGGLPKSSDDLVNGLSESWEVFRVSQVHSGLFGLFQFQFGAWVEVDYPRTPNVPPSELTNFSFESWFSKLLVTWSIDAVHIEHFQWLSSEMPNLARNLGIPVTWSVHDYYSICPTTQLLDEKNVFCGGKCTVTVGGDCAVNLGAPALMPTLKNSFVHVWQGKMASSLEKLDRIFAPSTAARRRLLENYPMLESITTVVEHGRDDVFFVPPAVPADRIVRKLLVLGAIGPHKGARVLASLVPALSDRSIELEIVGYASLPLAGKIHSWGPYETRELEAIAKTANFHAALVLPIWEETFCHTLTEAWMMGLPTIGFDSGAVGERIKATGNGIVVSAQLASAPGELAEQIDTVISNQDLMNSLRSNIQSWQESNPIPSNREMANSYSKAWLR